MTSTVQFRVARTPAERADVLRLRDAVYVRDQGRLADAADTAATFDRFDPHADYVLAYAGDEAIGTVKVVPDSDAGLPCEDMVDLGPLRTAGNRLTEFGHLMTLPEVRGRKVGMALMREALVHSVSVHGATHVLGDFFADEEAGGLRGFYLEIGFTAVQEPYRDTRFQGAPLSVVGVLDVRAAAARARTAAGADVPLLQYFFHDYAAYADRTAVQAKGHEVAHAPSGTR
ncbi:hypothetical protein GCM10010218_37330 [Streptomyces mashuensis]|uniref:N-acetyltransferase domain-containing protein n=1 Tax=Streptomyces mashuensis TaxID=33904 RepID=A0A919B5P7_9ACTN|nr:GNAT family N-acetyltransferase [Streptomyces mashuensis]GHF52403.1 hypothetical protein GCM10010218_37330 [Streptomyces mashuensis]